MLQRRLRWRRQNLDRDVSGCFGDAVQASNSMGASQSVAVGRRAARQSEAADHRSWVRELVPGLLKPFEQLPLSVD